MMEHKETGKVWLAGAGPGDAGLLTRKAEQVLESADVVVYDHLVGRDILARIRLDQKAVNVGKISGYHPIPQEEIGQILVEEARQGKKVVRLKGGDPFLFGRGGEELLKLKKAGIPFEVSPGGDVRPGCPGLCRDSGDSQRLCFLSSYRDRAIKEERRAGV